jgi:hypothetical protein
MYGANTAGDGVAERQQRRRGDRQSNAQPDGSDQRGSQRAIKRTCDSSRR